MNPTQIAVIGSGTMGAQIAAHCVNAGLSVYLFDLKKEGVNLAVAGKARLAKLDPEPLASKALLDFILTKNLEDDLDCLKNCDLIIEAISEDMSLKVDLYKKIAPYLNDTACLASNTSGLSITQLAKCLPEKLQSRFLGMHFFNPPRYLSLVELVPHAKTDGQSLDDLETFLVSKLGKEIVRAKDTPNFIANRLGVFNLLSTLRHAEELKIPLEVVDELTGKLVGRPKSATCRTLDLVGLDVLAHVVKTIDAQLPPWLQGLIDQGALGAKVKKGIYQKTAEGLMVWDIASKSYRPATQKANAEFTHALKTTGMSVAYQGLEKNPLPEAQFLYRVFHDLFAYAHAHLAEISGSRTEVDRALKFGFGWKQGVFELEAAIHETKHPEKTPEHLNLPVYQRQKYPAEPRIVYENEAAYAWEHEGALVLTFRTKLCTISDLVLEALNQARELAEKSYKGLIIWQRESEHFSAGADLMGLAGRFMLGGVAALDEALRLFQRTILAIRHAKVPVVTAVRGYVLGGGCELAMHSHKVVAALETYMGLVEVGVGIVPGAGGSKEMALRASKSDNPKEKLMQYFKQISMAETAKSAVQAKEMGYLRDSDLVIMNPNELLYVATQELNALAAKPFVRVREEPIKVQGLPAWGNMMGMIENMKVGAFASEFDALIASKVAGILSGGLIDPGMVDTDWQLRLEREAFLSLVQEDKTQARVQHMLETGQPLRN